MSKQEVYEQLKGLWEKFDSAHNGKFKKNAGDARKFIGEIKKLATPYRAASVEEEKASK